MLSSVGRFSIVAVGSGIVAGTTACQAQTRAKYSDNESRTISAPSPTSAIPFFPTVQRVGSEGNSPKTMYALVVNAGLSVYPDPGPKQNLALRLFSGSVLSAVTFGAETMGTRFVNTGITPKATDFTPRGIVTMYCGGLFNLFNKAVARTTVFAVQAAALPVITDELSKTALPASAVGVIANVAASTAAGFGETVLTHPMDKIVTRVQGKTVSLVDAVRTFTGSPGLAFEGFVPAVLRNVGGAIMIFGLREGFLKTVPEDRRGLAGYKAAAGGAAGFIAGGVTAPFNTLVTYYSTRNHAVPALSPKEVLSSPETRKMLIRTLGVRPFVIGAVGAWIRSRCR
ncbi:hypothetical protein EBR96_07455 [bacterium]|nr:hypothetical protein [bacterium]